MVLPYMTPNGLLASYLAQGGLKFTTILLPLPSRCEDSSYAPLHPAYESLTLEF